MKKIIMFVLISVFIYGCGGSNTVSEQKLKKALDIAYTELSKIDFDNSITRHQYPLDFAFINQYLIKQTYKKDIDCQILDQSDVNGTKHIQSCILKNVNAINSFVSSPDVCVLAVPDENTPEKVILIFFKDAEKTEKGVKYSTIMPMGIVVNLKTQKIGKI